jgi:hypothetical protein
MSNVVPFQGTERPTLTYLGGERRRGWFVLYEHDDYQHVYGPFPKAGTREFVLAISRASNGFVEIDWDSFPYTPDPRNGEVYATACDKCRYENGQWIEEPDGFMVVHMYRSGTSAGGSTGYKTLEEAQAEAERLARECNAVLS